MTPRSHALLGKLLIAALIINSLSGFSPFLTTTAAQKDGKSRKNIIVINAEQPNVWTLEQAHYLLAQMHRRNLDLKAKKLDDLDANEIAGLRFDVMRTLIEFGATFNQAELATNKMLSSNQNFNQERRQELITEREDLRKQARQLSGEVEELESQKASTDDEDEKKSIDAKIAAKNARIARLDKDIETDNNELDKLSEPSGQLKGTEAGAKFDASKFPKDALDKVFEDAVTKANEPPKLNATLRLDNFLQMQYEIISKQLSLLRDELGPGERLIFLELPQTVNVAHNEANDKWAQSWWRIAGYTRRRRDEKSVTAAPTPTAPVADNQRPITTADDFNSIFRQEKFTLLLKPSPTPTPTPAPGATPYPTPIPTPTRMQVSYYDEFVDLDGDYKQGNSILNGYLKDNSAKLENRMVRVVELIPRQSSLNVSDIKLRNRAGAFNFMLSTLFGFGSQLNVQREREQFSQFVQQELYSSAFGKGSREFGWTFTPMPGMDRLQSGVRTTYAVLVVPEEATSIVLESNGCYFPRTAYQPNDFEDTKDRRWNDDNRTSRNCGGTTSKAFVVPIPSANVDGSNNFWVSGISFQPVAKGKRIVVLISGKNFSPQMGVLINGLPLLQTTGLAQPLIRDDSEAGRNATNELKGAEVQGNLERVDSNKIVFSFTMPPDFSGTPTITLIAPGRAIDINWIEGLDINGTPNASLKTFPEKMFGNGPGPAPFRIDSVKVFRSRTPGQLTAQVRGAGFLKTGVPPLQVSDAVGQVLVNGSAAGLSTTFESPNLLTVNFPVPMDETIRVTLVSQDADLTKVQTIDSDAITNPARLSITSTEVVVFEAATEDEPATLVVKITGTGFTDKLKSSIGEVAVKSATEAILTITNPKAAATVTLTDEDTGQTVRTVITRKTRAPD